MIGCSTSISSSSTLQIPNEEKQNSKDLIKTNKVIVLVSKTFGYGWGGW